MKQIGYVIQDELDIHARPAGLIVKKAKEFQSAISIHAGDKQANALKIFEIMGLGTVKGQKLEIEISGPDEDAAAVAFEEFLKATL